MNIILPSIIHTFLILTEVAQGFWSLSRQSEADYHKNPHLLHMKLPVNLWNMCGAEAHRTVKTQGLWENLSSHACSTNQKVLNAALPTKSTWDVLQNSNFSELKCMHFKCVFYNWQVSGPNKTFICFYTCLITFFSKQHSLYFHRKESCDVRDLTSRVYTSVACMLCPERSLKNNDATELTT